MPEAKWSITSNGRGQNVSQTWAMWHMIKHLSRNMPNADGSTGGLAAQMLRTAQRQEQADATAAAAEAIRRSSQADADAEQTELDRAMFASARQQQSDSFAAQVAAGIGATSSATTFMTFLLSVFWSEQRSFVLNLTSVYVTFACLLYTMLIPFESVVFAPDLTLSCTA